MTGRARAISTHRRTPLQAQWALCSTPAGAIDGPAALATANSPAWRPIAGPDTVAGALRGTGEWSLDHPPRRFDAEDWWFRAVFDAPPAAAVARRSLAFAGLAGECAVWLNGAPLLSSHNMHVAHECALPALAPGRNELLMRFASLDDRLARRRPRPRWRAPMIDHAQLRWARVGLLGRTPGWSPPAPAIGPWRAIEWVDRDAIDVSAVRLSATVAGDTGQVALAVAIVPLDAGRQVESAVLRVARDGVLHDAALHRDAAAPGGFATTLAVPAVARWWPHTHGDPALYDATLLVRLTDTASAVEVDLGRIGFRTIAIDTADGDFRVRVNDVPVFCRGANWTPLDVVSPAAPAAATRAALAQVRAAGLNMLRVNGCMVYEDDAFFDACDANGLLVWQDFMFANMDYPADDPAFAASVAQEACQQLARWQAHPSLALVCGNSEVAQQAAMWGAARPDWSSPLFDRDLPALVREWCPDVRYWPSSAHGGAFPHQADAGTTAYYGVGAYLRPLDDARRAGVRFASECLAFANVPPAATLARMPGGAALRAHHPGWKERVPRDLGAGWDFDDVRDHYLHRLFGVDPVALRSTDHDRYLHLGRVVGAEVVQATIAEWRRPGSACRGALLWFLRDPWAGAGWGALDDRGTPKAAFHGLRRASAPIHLFLTDEGVNGVALHLVNDPAAPLAATIEVALYRDDGLRLRSDTRTVSVPAHGGRSWPLAEWFDGFVDTTRAFRFGPADHMLVTATAHDSDGRLLDRAFFLPDGLSAARRRDIGLAIDRIDRAADGSLDVAVSAQNFAQSVHFEADGYVAADEFFHIAPGTCRAVRLVPTGGAPARRIGVHATNGWYAATQEVPA